MPRGFNTDKNGGGFTEQQIAAVWSKGRAVQGYSSSYVRADACGALMVWKDYGNTASQWGWEVDHKHPVVHGGGDNIDNLQPLQWQNNRAKSDGPLVCAVPRR